MRSKPVAKKGTGGHGRDKLKGKGATPPAEMRPGHPAQRRAAAAKKSGGKGAPAKGAASAPAAGGGRRPPTGPRRDRRTDDEVVIGRNAVLEALQGGVPGRSLLVAAGLDHDERVTDVLGLATKLGLPVREVTRFELDRLVEGAPHQGLALTVAPYAYAHPDDLLTRAVQANQPALLVALDGVTDPRNLGAVVRSAAAFGAQGVVVPERRAAGVTAAAWKSSAGTLARLPVARAVNLPRALKSYAGAGLTVVGLAADAPVSLDDLEVAVGPVCVVGGSEGKGLGRLVAETCDLLVRIPMPGRAESLNASVAVAVTLAEVARRRRAVERRAPSA